jgi:hypothetical protein
VGTGAKPQQRTDTPVPSIEELAVKAKSVGKLVDVLTGKLTEEDQ